MTGNNKLKNCFKVSYICMEFDYTDIFGELWNKYALGCNTSFTDSARLTAKYVLCSYFLG